MGASLLQCKDFPDFFHLFKVAGLIADAFLVLLYVHNAACITGGTKLKLKHSGHYKQFLN